MKKHLILLFLVIFSVCNSFAQSKKDQIEQLNYRVDSLIRVLSSERINIKKEKASLEQYIVDLDKTITKLNAQAAKDISLIKSKELELSKVSSALSSLTSLLKVKSDSLNLVLADLEKLKPPVKVSPVIPVLDNKGPIKGVAIGTQTWTTKNLDVATFRNGDLIPEAKTDEEWKAAGENKQPAWCYYDNKAANGTKYGKLYNWYAVVDVRGLAPAGWHIPTNEEWTLLENSLGGHKFNTGEKMKSRSGWDSYIEDITCANCESWNAEYRRKKECNVCQDTRINGKKTFSANGTNSSGFSALPGGWRGYPKNGHNVGDSGFWWSASESSESEAWYRLMFSYKYSFLDEGKYLNYKKSDGFSVRCVKD